VPRLCLDILSTCRVVAHQAHLQWHMGCMRQVLNADKPGCTIGSPYLTQVSVSLHFAQVSVLPHFTQGCLSRRIAHKCRSLTQVSISPHFAQVSILPHRTQVSVLPYFTQGCLSRRIAHKCLSLAASHTRLSVFCICVPVGV